MQESPLRSSAANSFFFDFRTSSGSHVVIAMEEPDPDDEEDELEFTFPCTGHQKASPVSADKIFLNGQIKPLLPPFNFPTRDEGSDGSRSQKRPPAVRAPLWRLFCEEREWNSSWSSDEIEGVASETYCLWRPKQEAKRASAKKKKNKTSEDSGNASVSKRWKFKDFVCTNGSKKVSDEPLG